MTLSPPDRSDSNINDLIVDFLKSFDGMKYRTKISAMPAEGARSLVVDYADVSSHDLGLAVELERKPKVLLKIFEEALAEVLNVEAEGYAKGKNLHVRIRGLYDQTSLRSLNTSHESRLILVSGIISKTHQVKPAATVLGYRCIPNDHLVEIELDDFSGFGKPPRPWRCTNCDSMRFYLDKESTKKQDFQLIAIQEMPEDLKPGQLPRAFVAYAFDDMVDRVTPGQRVLLTGIVQTETDGKSRLFETRLLVNNIEIIGRRPEDTPIAREEEEQFRAFAKQPGAFDRLVNSINPAIFGHENVKGALLLQLAGSPQKQLPNGTNLRGDISILLVGDPGIAKSQQLKAVVKMAPRAFYTVGRGTTAAGLGAAVVKEPNGGYSLEAGAAVWCDLGVLAIDEFSSLRQDDAAVLNEIMEQGSCSIAKAGINVNLNARVSVLAAMNPVDGKYDPYKNVVENISVVSIPLLTRFDLIFVMMDEVDSAKDRQITSHIAEMRNTGRFPVAPPLTEEFLKRYLLFVKRLEPELTSEAVTRLQDYYERTRRSANEAGLSITPRWFDALIRLTLARARLLLHERATEDDALSAINVMEGMMNFTLKDPATGKPDVGVLYNKPVSEKGLREAALDLFLELSGERKDPVEDKAFYEGMEKLDKFSSAQAEKVFQDMWKSGVIYEIRAHFFKKA